MKPLLQYSVSRKSFIPRSQSKKGKVFKSFTADLNFKHLASWFTALFLVLFLTPNAIAQEVLLGLNSIEGPQGGGTAFTINSSGTNFTMRKGFYKLGSSPFGDLTKGKDGNFYGMTAEGGINSGGTIFKMTPDSKVTILHHLDFPEGVSPRGNLVLGTDGNFYGMTYVGGANKNGTIFKVTPGGTLTVLHHLNKPIDGGAPEGSLVQGSDGNFYGMTLLGGKYDYGTIFKITPAGVFTVLRSFNGTTNGGASSGNLVQGKDGNFYGMTSQGGTYGYGTIFKVTPTGRFAVLRSFNNDTDGGLPGGSLIQSSDGNFYGMTYAGGENFNGTIFKITAKGAFSVLHAFRSEDGSHPYGNLVRGSDGNFYGMTSDGGNNYYGTIFKLTPGGTFTVLKHLDFSTTGANPRGSLVQGNDGIFYGMAGSYGPSSYGTIFKITPAGTFTVLVALPNDNQGNTPYSSLVQGKDGFYYGTTSQGGKHGNGTIFKMCTDGTFTTLYSLNINTDGANPESALIQANDGNFYGTASTGGKNGYGTIFKITPGGTFRVLHSFDFNTNGRNPYGGLVQGNDNNFYGITFQGGTIGGGTVYKITPSGTLTTIRQLSFSDGADSKATLVKGKDGNFYGTTHIGGTNTGGTIFKITPKGAFSVLYNFTNASGGFTRGSLSQDAEGNFYGLTPVGGSKGYGTIFKVNSSGTVTVLYNFDKITDGSKPNGSLVRDSKGNLFGMNSEGGTYQGGTIFRLTPKGTFTVLRHLNKSADGGSPQGSLILQKANPVAKAQSVVTSLNTPKAITLSGTGGNPLVYTIVSQPKNGRVKGSGPNRLYTPKPGFTGTDSFTYTVTWGCQTSAAKTISISVGELTAKTLRINSGGNAVATSLGEFSNDAYFIGASTITSTTAEIYGTNDDALYQTTRKAETSGGSFNYSIPVTNGNYTVKLYFAEIAFVTSGKRKFNVNAEGTSWLTNYDIFAAAGGARKAVIATKNVLVTDGMLHLSFISVVDKACVAAIEVIPVANSNRLANQEPSLNQNTRIISIFPNPVINKLTLFLPGIEDQVITFVTDITGAQVSTQKQQIVKNHQLELDVQSLKAGVYVLHVQTNQEVQSLRFIKK
ncbi:choice-of-anchor tandem repeat GloVer-containing protein [Adhaeribacter radiodurans]|uniref:T9SS type A sorting domain-containing protein n=1 Tax=Adhaeribacter radiodurans TaxID=2745197 RepID=A0A7L7LC09_9BACT|nr:choice-of-anchor tandem repeat GloVer-containing protein [Adhaeribacter radiodurans]QMU30380.1 T9SS type A sorting domain-containing protein [Adhaeribacter radiodurans]